MRLIEKLFGGVDPQRNILRAIEWVIATCTLIGGIYIFTPLRAASAAVNAPTAFASALTSPYSIFVWGLILVIGAIAVMIGKITKRPQYKSFGWFAIFLARFFQILTTILAVGFLPITWIYPFTIMLIVILLWLRARYEVYQANASP